ncbi:hypothetical protein ATN37_25505 [Rhodococcus sp. MH15]|uniref:hypothetical protein n=1 Tax=Rhodococcus sp. MH15 TaxID=1761014 RepID=UPI001C4F1F4A|nr:hypothetical protein [Rhodococcus sp. MH15]MBW0294021.1 hypothetical protein [Rhodococcus sp. MH15]
MKWNPGELTREQRQSCLVLLGGLSGEVAAFQRSELGSGPEVLALDFAYAKVAAMIDDRMSSILQAYD